MFKNKLINLLFLCLLVTTQAVLPVPAEQEQPQQQSPLVKLLKNRAFQVAAGASAVLVVAGIFCWRAIRQVPSTDIIPDQPPTEFLNRNHGPLPTVSTIDQDGEEASSSVAPEQDQPRRDNKKVTFAPKRKFKRISRVGTSPVSRKSLTGRVLSGSDLLKLRLRALKTAQIKAYNNYAKSFEALKTLQTKPSDEETYEDVAFYFSEVKSRYTRHKKDPYISNIFHYATTIMKEARHIRNNSKNVANP